jgi:hypothetical protein
VHANVVFVDVDAIQADPAHRGLREHVSPRVSQTTPPARPLESSSP